MNRLLWHYSFCLMAGPVGIFSALLSGGMQNFCSTSQWWDAEFLQYQSVVWCRISAPLASGVTQNFCSTNQRCDAEFLQHQSVVGYRISAAPVSGAMQNFCSTSQWCNAEFLQRQSVVGCRISAVSVSGVMQNSCGTSQWCDAEFLRYLSVVWCSDDTHTNSNGLVLNPLVFHWWHASHYGDLKYFSWLQAEWGCILLVHWCHWYDWYKCNNIYFIGIHWYSITNVWWNGWFWNKENRNPDNLHNVEIEWR